MNRKKQEIDYYKNVYRKDYKKHMNKEKQSKIIYLFWLFKDVQNYEKSIKFASSYIFVLFSSAICGYFLAKELFGWDFHNRMVASIGLCYITLMVEIFIFIIKNNKHNKERQKTRK